MNPNNTRRNFILPAGPVTVLGDLGFGDGNLFSFTDNAADFGLTTEAHNDPGKEVVLTRPAVTGAGGVTRDIQFADVNPAGDPDVVLVAKAVHDLKSKNEPKGQTDLGAGGQHGNVTIHYETNWLHEPLQFGHPGTVNDFLVTPNSVLSTDFGCPELTDELGSSLLTFDIGNENYLHPAPGLGSDPIIGQRTDCLLLDVDTVTVGVSNNSGLDSKYDTLEFDVISPDVTTESADGSINVFQNNGRAGELDIDLCAVSDGTFNDETTFVLDTLPPTAELGGILDSKVGTVTLNAVTCDDEFTTSDLVLGSRMDEPFDDSGGSQNLTLGSIVAAGNESAVFGDYLIHFGGEVTFDPDGFSKTADRDTTDEPFNLEAAHTRPLPVLGYPHLGTGLGEGGTGGVQIITGAIQDVQAFPGLEDETPLFIALDGNVETDNEFDWFAATGTTLGEDANRAKLEELLQAEEDQRAHDFIREWLPKLLFITSVNMRASTWLQIAEHLSNAMSCDEAIVLDVFHVAIMAIPSEADNLIVLDAIAELHARHGRIEIVRARMRDGLKACVSGEEDPQIERAFVYVLLRSIQGERWNSR